MRHHPEGGHAPLTEKALLLLELIWSLFDWDSSTFKTSFKWHVIGLSFEVYNSFLPQLASKLQAVESVSPEKVHGKGAFY